MSNIQDLKQLLKEKAAYIRSERNRAHQLKLDFKGPEANEIHNRLAYKESYDYRYHHIAYCELRGKTREQIEQPREGNEPYERKIQAIKEKYAWTPEEITAFEERKANHEALRISQA